MITISVNSRPLYIPADTAIVYEQSSNTFGEEGINADIVWSFEIPAEMNQPILGAAQYMYSGGHRRYDCEVAVDGIPFSRGYLYIQGSTNESRLTCGIVANTFGVGFGERMLKENDYGSDIVISDTEEEHKERWRQFLMQSLDEESIYKFFLFADSKFYKDNDDYGMHAGKKSPLYSTAAADDITIGFVNRLFFIQYMQRQGNGTYLLKPTSLVEVSEEKVCGARIFNTASATGQNGYCFAPALRLDWMVRKVFENAGLNVSGSFFEDENVKRLYAQSMNAMDGSSTQYGEKNYLLISNVKGVSQTGSTQPFICSKDNEQYTSFYPAGYPRCDFALQLPQNELSRNMAYDGGEKFKVVDEIYAIAFLPTGQEKPPAWRMKTTNNKNEDPFIYGELMTMEQIKSALDIADSSQPSSVRKIENGVAQFNYTAYILGVGFNRTATCTPLINNKSSLIQITPSAGNTRDNLNNGYIRGSLQYNGVTPGNFGASYKFTNYTVRLVKCKVASSNTDISIRWKDYFSLMKVKLSAYGQMEKLYDYEYLDNVGISLSDPTLNIFSRTLEWRKHMPHLSNGEFIGLICQTFGLSLFANPLTRQAQLNLFSDTMQGRAFDISQWVSTKERMEYNPKQYSVSLSPTLGENKTEASNILDEVESKSSMPSALYNLNKSVFVRNEAVFRQAVEDDDKKFVWQQNGGDSRPLIAGADDADTNEEVSIDTNTPNMAFIDEQIDLAAQKYMCQIEVEGCSSMFDKEYKGEFPLILQQYAGKRTLQGSNVFGYIEDANPTALTMDGAERHNAINLATAGEKSIGSIYLKPVYDMLGNCDNFRLVAHLPSWAFFKVAATMQPQDGATKQQVRWLLCDGVRLLPTKISSEMSARNSIVCTIECVAPHVEL